MKKCTNCFQLKPEDAFYRKLAWRQSRCKACNAEVVRGYVRRKQEKVRRARWDEIYGRTQQSVKESTG